MLLVGLVLIISSCVTNKKYIYLQKGDVNKKNLAKDTVVRDYDLQSFDYKIQPEDIISVRFESLTPREFDFLRGDEQVNMNLAMGGALLIGELVDKNGEIPFHVIGKVKVSGLTVFEIQEKLQALANEYLESPIVKVRLINFRITVLGEVNREGTVTLGNNRVGFIEALGLSGGLTDLADKANVKLIRQQNEKAEIQYINLLDENFLNSPNYFVHQNDILIVPALKQRAYRKYFGQNLSLVLSSISLLLVVSSFIKK